MHGSIASNLQAVRERIARAAERSGRAAEGVTLIAVTKSVSLERVLEAVSAGVTHLGENKVQEAEAKFGESRAELLQLGITLHMIGSLQRNKAARAAALFDYVHSVDRVELVTALDKAAVERSGGPLPVLLQVNLTGESTKSGVSPEELPVLADALAGRHGLRGVGLMTIARLGAGEGELRRTFAALREMLYGLRNSAPGDWRHLSMGMTDDYEYAIEEGATMLRIGRAIFGERKT